MTEVSEPATPQKNGSTGGSFPDRFDAMVRTAAQVIQGKDDVLRKAIVCMIAEGHVLLEDVPGVGKTSLARALAHTVKVDWNRIQFTPDLLPSDVTGVSIFNQRTAEFEFRHGPIFANLVVGDEINRASPKTQSALLEVMEEGNVSVDGNTYRVPHPFMVVATQNPIDIEGTYRLPEAQLDRFLMRLSMGYPDHEAERRVLRTQKNGSNADTLTAVTDAAGVQAMIEEARQVEVSAAAEDYIINLATFTREAPEVRLGLSPRGSLALLRAARVVALASGRNYVTPEDVKDLVPEVLAHRIIITPEAELQGHTSDEIVARALESVAVPRAASGS